MGQNDQDKLLHEITFSLHKDLKKSEIEIARQKLLIEEQAKSLERLQTELNGTPQDHSNCLSGRVLELEKFRDFLKDRWKIFLSIASLAAFVIGNIDKLLEILRKLL